MILVSVIVHVVVVTDWLVDDPLPRDKSLPVKADKQKDMSATTAGVAEVRVSSGEVMAAADV